MNQETKQQEKKKHLPRGTYPRGGWGNKLSWEDKTVMVYGRVKRKHFDVAMEEIRVLIQKYR
jgi:hypothetical protein